MVVFPCPVAEGGRVTTPKWITTQRGFSLKGVGRSRTYATRRRAPGRGSCGGLLGKEPPWPGRTPPNPVPLYLPCLKGHVPRRTAPDGSRAHLKLYFRLALPSRGASQGGVGTNLRDARVPGSSWSRLPPGSQSQPSAPRGVAGAHAEGAMALNFLRKAYRPAKTADPDER